eukprot:1425376-Alexandrium_andersonii.AAC.1
MCIRDRALKRHKAHRLPMRKRCRLGPREEAACRRHELRAVRRLRRQQKDLRRWAAEAGLRAGAAGQ